jgi:hypothetical protein
VKAAPFTVYMPIALDGDLEGKYQQAMRMVDL